MHCFVHLPPSFRVLVPSSSSQGLREGEALVRKLPTREGLHPNFLDRSEIRLMVEDYGGFLEKIFSAHSESL